MVNVQQILNLKGSDIWSISPDDSVYNALRLMKRVDVGALLVMENDQLIGIISERDYARKVILLGKTSKETKVSEIMTSKLFTIHPLQTCEECMEVMTKERIRHLPAVLDGKVIGVVSIGDVVKQIIHQQREAIKDLSEKVLQTDTV